MSKSYGLLIAAISLICSIVFVPGAAYAQVSLPAEINKSFTPISIVAGQTSRLSVTIFNPNTFSLSNAAWTDNLVGVQPGIFIANPPNVSNTCGGTVTAVAGGTTLSLSGGSVPAQTGVTPGECTVSVDVSSTTPGNLINTIPTGGLTATGGGFNITNTTPASATLRVGAVQPPTLSKAFAPNTIFAGDVSTLTITIRNNDLNTSLTQVSLTDTLPANVTVASAPASPQCGGTITSTANSVTLTGGTIPANSTCTVVVTVTSSTQGTYTNTIPAGPGGPGSIRTQQGVTNAAPASATLNVQAISPIKAFSPASIPAGGVSTLTITLRNPTASAYTGVNLTDNLPAGLQIAAAPAPINNCGGALTATAGTQLIQLAGGTIPASPDPPPAPTVLGTCTIIVPVTTPANAPTATLTNTIPIGALTTAQGISNPAAATANLGVQSALNVTKAFAPATIAAGGTSTVTITLQNRTGSPLTGVNFTDTLPAGLTVVGTPVSPQCGGTVTSTATSVALAGGTIPASATPPTPPGTCTVTFQVTSATAGTYTNTIPANDVTTDQGISNVATATSNPLNVVDSGGPVTVSKAFQTNPVVPGAPTRLRITITAPADTALTGLTVSDTLPGDLVIVVVPPGPGISANPATTCTGGTLTAVAGTQLIQLTGSAINTPGGSCTITVYVVTNTPGSYPNTIPANAVTTTQGRTNANPATATLTVNGFSMSKVFTPPTVAPNGISTLTITLTNAGPSALISVSLTDSLTTMGGNGTTTGVFVAPTPNASTTCGSGVITAAPGTQTISMAGGTVPAQVGGVPGVCTINVDVQGRGGVATRTNTIPIANVSGTDQSTGTLIRPRANATAQLSIANLTIGVVKGFNPLTVFGGSSSTLSVQLVNPNNAALTGIAFTDNMPAGMIIANPPNFNTGTCGGTLTGTPGANTFSFSGGSLTANTSCTLTLSATMTVNGNLTNTIPAGAVTTFNGVSSPQPASASLTNLPGASVSKVFAPNPIVAGAANYSLLTITIQNTSTFALTGLGLSDALPGTLPAGLMVAGASAPPPFTDCNGALTADQGTPNILLVGGTLAGSSSCTIVVAVTSTVPGSYLNTIPAGALSNNEGATNTTPATDTLVVTAPAALGDFVWNDLNANGIQDAGEAGIAGVTVRLLDASGNQLATTTTDANGLYLFDNLTPGTYQVEFVPPAGYTVSPRDQGANDAVDSDADTATGRTGLYTLAAGERNLTVDAGLNQLASLGNFVWLDTDADGIQDAGENGIPNVTVRLLDASGNQLATTTTDANGLYLFSNLTPGTYQVEFVPPAGYVVSPQDQGGDDALDSDANPATGRTVTTTLVAGENDLTWDAGMSSQFASLGNFVWLDADADGIQDAGENGVPNVTVRLLDGNGAVVTTTTTDANGLYLFSNLTPGTYQVEFVPLAGYVVSPQDQGGDDALDSDANPATGRTVTTTLVAGENDLTWDAGMYQPASLGDFVWLDADANGIQDAGESGIAGVTVRLLDANGNQLATTTTDANGFYSFTNLTPGTYRVDFVPPAGYTITTANQGGNDAADSDANPATGETANVTLAPGEANMTLDAGLSLLAALGDFVWLDANADGIQDAGESGIAGVTVRLLDVNGNQLATTTTDANGFYSFTNLTPGTYRVDFVPPAGYTITTANQGADDAVDSDADPTTGETGNYTLAAGEMNSTVDAGLINQLASLGDFVWNDTDADGVQDPGESGIDGVTVQLFTAAGVLQGTTTTAGGGLYSFTGLTPGDYYVVFTLPSGRTFSPRDQGGNDAADSDADTSTGRTTTTTLVAGENDVTWDAGMFTPPSGGGGGGGGGGGSDDGGGAPAAAAALIPVTGGNAVVVDPAIAKRLPIENAQVGDTVTFIITVTNPNAVPVTGVSVDDPLPSLADFVTATTTQGTFSYNAASHTVTFDIGTMAAGQVVEIGVSTKVNEKGRPPLEVCNEAQLRVDGQLREVSEEACMQILPGLIPVTGVGPGTRELPLTVLLWLVAAASPLAAWLGWKRWRERGHGA